MDLHFLSLDLRGRRAELRAADARGVTHITLEGAQAESVIAAAQPFFTWAQGRVPASARTPRDSTLCAVEIDALSRTLRVGYVAERAPTSNPDLGASLPAAHAPELTYSVGEYDKAQTLLRDAARTAIRAIRPRASEPAELAHDQRWEYLYQHDGDGWELARPAPPLCRYFDAHPLRQGERALVPGCGRGHEALYLARQALRVGAFVEATDLAPTAIHHVEAAAQREGLSSVLGSRVADLFEMARPGTATSGEVGAYDVIVEHTCFCAILPERRAEYVEVARRLLKASGRLVGLFYTHPDPGGPPFGATHEEILGHLRTRFTIEHAEVPGDSILTRAGHELLVVARPSA